MKPPISLGLIIKAQRKNIFCTKIMKKIIALPQLNAAQGLLAKIYLRLLFISAECVLFYISFTCHLR